MNCQVSSDVNSLDKLNEIYNWIPNKDCIRPSDKDIEKKSLFFDNIKNFYESDKDYVLVDIFGFSSIINDNGKLKVIEDNIEDKYIFEPNIFPYNLPYNTKHYVLWYSINKNISEDRINSDINESIIKVGSNNFDFVWYENPTKTVESVFHVQVFWIDLSN